MTPRLRDIVARDATGAVAARHPSPRRVLRILLEILDGTQLCSLATVTPTGRAHVNAAYFAYANDLSIYFLSHPSARHCKNLTRNPSGALSIFRSDQKWGGEDRGAQLFGEVERVDDGKRASAEAVYAARFPLYGRWLTGRAPGGPKAATQLRTYSFYRFASRRVTVFDEKAFPEASFVSAVLGSTS